MTKTIVVTGATGTIGDRAVTQLLAAKASVRALVHTPSKAAALEQRGASTAVGSYEDRAALERAFAGADTVVSITAANAHAIEQTIATIDAAKAAGVRKIVRVSALKAALDGPTDNTRQHGRTEQYLAASGLAHVILRPHLFMQMLLGFAPQIVGEGTLYFGVGSGRMGMIDTRDISDAIAVAATSDAWDGQTLELTGPTTIDFHAVAAALARGLGREVTYIPVPPEAAGDALRGFGADEWTVGIVRDYCRAYSAGFGEFTTDNVRRVTDHAPRSIEDFVREVFVPAVRQ